MRNILFFTRKDIVMRRCSQRVDYERASGSERGHNTPTPCLHHREVAPEEVLKLHKLLQT